VLQFIQTLILLVISEEDEGVREMDDPEVGMVWGKSRENFSRFEVIVKSSFKVVEIEHELEEIGVGNSIGYVELAHLSLSDVDGF
jgi:hypothetical protein